VHPLPAVIQDHISAYKPKDVEGMLACLAEEVTFRNIPAGTETTAASNKTVFAEMAEIADSTRVATDPPNGSKAGQDLKFSGTPLLCAMEGSPTPYCRT